jgi:hypothetical protein
VVLLVEVLLVVVLLVEVLLVEALRAVALVLFAVLALAGVFALLQALAILVILVILVIPDRRELQVMLHRLLLFRLALLPRCVVPLDRPEPVLSQPWPAQVARFSELVHCCESTKLLADPYAKGLSQYCLGRRNPGRRYSTSQQY